MATPYLLSDNLFDTVLHPDYVVTDTLGAPASAELFRCTDNLRDVTRFAATGATAVFTALPAAAPASCLVLDRGHNLGGASLTVDGTNDPTWTPANVVTLASLVVPTSPGGLPTDTNGCLTPEGVFWRRFGAASYRYWRVQLLRSSPPPIVTGLYLGAGYRLPTYLESPNATDERVTVRPLRSELGWAGVRVKRHLRAFAMLDFKIQVEESDYQALRPHLHRLLFDGQPWWVCVDDETSAGAQRMRLYQVPGEVDFDPQQAPVHRALKLALEEVIPRVSF